MLIKERLNDFAERVGPSMAKVNPLLDEHFQHDDMHMMVPRA